MRTMLPLGLAALLVLSLCSLRAYGGASLLEGRAGLKWPLALCFVLGAAISYGGGVRSLLPLLSACSLLFLGLHGGLSPF